MTKAEYYSACLRVLSNSELLRHAANPSVAMRPIHIALAKLACRKRGIGYRKE